MLRPPHRSISYSCFLQINIFKGGSRDPAKDSWIGWFLVDLSELLSGTRLKGSFGLTPVSAYLAPPPFSPAGAQVGTAIYIGKVQAEFKPAPALEEAGVGSRILTVSGCDLQSVPPRWKLPAAEHDVDEAPPASGSSADPHSLAALCDDHDENP